MLDGVMFNSLVFSCFCSLWYYSSGNQNEYFLIVTIELYIKSSPQKANIRLMYCGFRSIEDQRVKLQIFPRSNKFSELKGN